MILQPGQKLHFDQNNVPKYVVQGHLGEGGQGCAYRAIHTAFEEMVVIKTPKGRQQYEAEGGMDYEEYVQNFIKEAKVLAQLRRSPHPNIVPVLDLFEERGTPEPLWCMVLDFVEGRPGQEHLGRAIAAGAMGEAEAVTYVQQVGAALAHLHRLPKPIVHRDVKPSNIVVRRSDNQAVLIDFGLAREFLPHLTKTYTRGGTPLYGAPEQFNPRTRLGDYTDVYGLAATLFHLVTGQPPLPGFLRELEVLRGQADPLGVPDGVSESVRRAIVAGMALEIERRSQTMGEWLRLLAGVGNPVGAGGEAVRTKTEGTVKAPGGQSQGSNWMDGLGPPQPDPLVEGLRNMGRGVKNFVKEVLREEEAPQPPQARKRSSAQVPAGSPRPPQRSVPPLGQKLVLQLRPAKGGRQVKLELLPIPGGTFWMGQTEAETRQLKQEAGEETYQTYFARELPRQRVTVPPFWMGRYPVTQAQYEAVMGENPATKYEAKFVGPDQPVVGVSWEDAVAFCQKLTQRCQEQLQGGKIVLPTEAQWEYACRAETETAFYFGDRLEPHQANYGCNQSYNGSKTADCKQVTTPVGSFPANAWGLQDLHGNVWEWCQDEFHEFYAKKPEALKRDGSIPWEGSNSNVLGDDRSGQIRVLRGGSWVNDPWVCRSAYRLRVRRVCFYYGGGFRLVLAFRTS